MKKFLCLILAVGMILSVTSCKKASESASVGGGSEAINGFMKAICQLDMAEAEKYVSTDSDIMSNIGFSGIDELKILAESLLTNYVSLDGIENEVNDFIDGIFGRVTDSIEYEIVKTDSDGEKNIFTVETKIPDFESLADMDIQNSFGKEISALQSAMAEGESLESKVWEILPELNKKTVDFLDNALKDMEKKSVITEVVVEKVGEQWLITSSEAPANFDVIYSIFNLFN